MERSDGLEFIGEDRSTRVGVKRLRFEFALSGEIDFEYYEADLR
jgi:hypothetical protein